MNTSALPAPSQPQAASHPQAMTPAELDEALELHSPVLLKQLYEAAQRQVTFETGRQGRLDAKATGLLQAVGLSLTVLAMMAPRLPENARGAVLWGLWVVLLLGLSAALMAIWALRVRKGEYVTVNERTLFSKELLADADSHVKDEQDQVVTMFYRTTTAHLWQIVQAQERIHNAKAEWIWRGQMAFGGFLLGVLGLGLVFLGGYR